jgi:hypothetical protein
MSGNPIPAEQLHQAYSNVAQRVGSPAATAPQMGAATPAQAPAPQMGAAPAGSAAPAEAAAQATGDSGNFISRMSNLAEQYAKPAARAMGAVAESPLGRAVGSTARFLGSAPVLGAQLMLHSGGLNEGEDQELALMHHKQDIERQMMANKHATEMNKYIQAKQKLGNQ